MTRTLLLCLPVALVLGACAPQLTAGTATLTVDNRSCLAPATVFIDGQQVGRVASNSAGVFQVTRGSHTINVDNDGLVGAQPLQVSGDVTWKNSGCL